MKLLKRVVYADGLTGRGWVIIATRRWSLEWHPRVPQCRTGWYFNRRGSYGLYAALNIPIIGDFSLWKHWISGDR